MSAKSHALWKELWGIERHHECMERGTWALYTYDVGSPQHEFMFSKPTSGSVSSKEHKRLLALVTAQALHAYLASKFLS